MSLKLEDFSDRELLHLVDDNADGQGWVDAIDVAEAVSSREPPIRSVSIRFSWLMRYGILENEDYKPEEGPKRKRWRLTKAGRQHMHGTLPAAQQRALENLAAGSLVSVTSLLSGRLRDASPEAAILMRREFTHGVAQRRKPWGRLKR